LITYKGIHHVSLCVRDLERSKFFYMEMLGFTEIERPPFDFPGAWIAVGTGGQQLHLIVHEGQTLRQGDMDSRDGHFALRVGSYKGTLERLKQKGITYDARPQSKAGFPQIYVLDPDRNIIEFNADPFEE
jgi:glyoxylase I family protein